jgi:hypothetical protein
MIERYCVIRPDASESGVSASLAVGLTEAELIELCTAAFPEGAGWSKYPGLRSIKVFEFRPGLWAVSYTVIGDGHYKLKTGRLRAWIAFQAGAELGRLLAEPGWIAKLYGGARAVWMADPNFPELEANLARFTKQGQPASLSVTQDPNGLSLRYSGDPYDWTAMEEAIRAIVVDHFRKNGDLLPFTTLSLSLPLQKPFKEIVVGFPSEEANTQVTPPAIVPRYSRVTLVAISLIVVGVLMACLLIFSAVSAPPPPTETPTAEVTPEAPDAEGI